MPSSNSSLHVPTGSSFTAFCGAAAALGTQKLQAATAIEARIIAHLCIALALDSAATKLVDDAISLPKPIRFLAIASAGYEGDAHRHRDESSA
jgi:hypothetical protein